MFCKCFIFTCEQGLTTISGLEKSTRRTFISSNNQLYLAIEMNSVLVYQFRYLWICLSFCCYLFNDKNDKD